MNGPDRRMSRILILTSLLMVSAVQGQIPPQEPEPQQPEQEVADQPIRVDVNLVRLRFTVRGQDGRYVNDLQRDDFRVVENGAAQELVLFEPPRNVRARSGALWLSFLLDVSGSTYATRAEEIVAAQTFFDNITDATRIGIFGFTDSLIPFQDYTSNRELALKAFGEARRHLGRTAIYDSLNSLMARQSSPSGDGVEKAIILLSDGLDDGYRLATATASRARTLGFKIYTILVPSAAQIYIASNASPSANPGDGEEQRKKQAAFASLSSLTGGLHFGGFEAILDFDDTLGRINDHLFGNLYTLGYYSDRPPRANSPRRITVRASDASLTVSSPFKKIPRELELKRDYIAALFDDRALSSFSGRSAFREIGAHIAVLSPRGEGDLRGIPFRINISPYTFQKSDRQGVRTQLGIIGVLVDGEGKEAVRLREIFRVDLGPKEIRNGRGIVYTNELRAPPGTYELRVALLELATWRLTSFERPVFIPSR